MTGERIEVNESFVQKHFEYVEFPFLFMMYAETQNSVGIHEDLSLHPPFFFYFYHTLICNRWICEIYFEDDFFPHFFFPRGIFLPLNCGLVFCYLHKLV